MSRFNVPAGMSLQSVEKDSVTLTVDADHTVGVPHIVIFDRRVPTVNGNTFTQPRYRIRVIQGNVDQDAVPIQARTLADIEFQWRVGNEPSWVSSQILTIVSQILAIEDFDELVFGRQALPTYYCETPEED